MPMLPIDIEALKKQYSFADNGLSIRGWLSVLIVSFLVYKIVAKFISSRSDKAFGQQHGCQPAETWLPYKWPFGLDILKLQYDAVPDGRFLRFQSQYFDKYGPTMGIKLLGNVSYLTTDPKNVESVLSTNFEVWGMGSRTSALDPWLGDGIFTQEGNPWKHSRELLRRQFARVQHQDLSVFDGHIKDLISSMSSKKGVIDLQPLFARYTLSTTTALLFGESVKAISAKETDEFEECFDYAAEVSAVRMRLPGIEWAYKPKKFIEACDQNKKYANYFVKLALDDMKNLGIEIAREKYTFIIDLYEELQDVDKVRDQLLGVLVAGRDTTAFLLSWCFYHLVRNPKVMKRLSEEIHSVRESAGEISRKQINKMPYLRCVINEINRLYPQVPMNVRFALRTTTIPSGGGPDGTSPILIPKGTSVAYSIYHMHRRTDIYGEDANDFRPERWENEKLRGIGWGFMPFHGGPRLCLGKDFALVEASYAIIRIIEAFPDLKLPPGEEVVSPGEERQLFSLVVSILDGCNVVLN